MVAGCGSFGVAMSALVDRNRVNSSRKERQQPVERAPGLSPGVKEQDRRRGVGASRCVGEAHAGGEANVADTCVLVDRPTLARCDRHPAAARDAVASLPTWRSTPGTTDTLTSSASA